MHCPRCGQEQASAQIRFCSRCGFQLGVVSDLLANGGALPNYGEQVQQRSSLFTRRNGLVFTLFWFLTFLFILTPITAVLELDELVPVFGIFSIFGSLILLLISLLVLPKENKKDAGNYAQALQFAQAQSQSSGTKDQNALPPQRTEPASVYSSPQAGGWKAPDTGEFAVPSSVTENTTKLLKKEEGS